MSYNRLGAGQDYEHDDNGYTPPPRRYQTPNYGEEQYPRPMDHSSPVSQYGYQLQDRPPAHLEIPMGPGAPPAPGTPSDRLQGQPTYSVENMQNTYGHNEDYEAHYQQPSHAGGYAVDPFSQHDAGYGNHRYPSESDQPQTWESEHIDTRPILQGGTSYGPDPVEPQPGYAEEAPPTPSPAPIRRWKTVKEIQLFNGNLVLDCPVPPRLLNQVDHARPPERDEFTHMRYSAATCDPGDFYSERFTLRQKLFAKPRHTELFIVVTMYNEDEVLFARTMIGVIKNIEYMNSRTSSKTWGKDAWKKIVVCVVSDGRLKINPRTRALIAALGVYQDGIAKNKVNGKDVTAHIYEYTTQMTMELKKDVVNVKRGNTPVQMLFCLKEQNQKKINSHRWFFQAFGQVLDPNICVLIDAGTRPGKDSIYLLWKAFDREPMCAGACGEIKAMIERGKNLWRPLVATQNFEYKMSNILDKPMESAFGFISVLPGAFSAYRYIALQNDKTGTGPLDKYFLGEKLHGAGAGIFKANMYLAEDRILCFELVTKRNCAWILHYVKSSTGETDVPTEMSDFILQRRRWLNGSFFAAVYAITHAMMVFRSGHSFMRKLMFLFEFAYQTINMIFAWFAIGNFFLVFRILTFSLGDKDLLSTTGNVLAVIFEWFYLGVLISCFVLALGNRPQGSNRLYMSMVWFWVLIMAYLMFASIFITVRSIQAQLAENDFTVGELFSNNLFFTLIVSMASTYLLWFVASFLFLDPWHMFTCLLQYLLMTPTYINILNVYAFCNTHDVTWGTKGATTNNDLGAVSTKPGGKVEVSIPTDDADLNTQYERELAAFRTKFVEPKKEPDPATKQEDYYKGFRSTVVLLWMFSNLALCAVVLQTGGLKVAVGNAQDASASSNERARIYMAVVLWSVAGLSLVRFVGALWFLVTRLFRGV